MCVRSGKCGNVCPTDPSAITICNIGTCIFTCTGGTTQCGTPLAPFCADTTNDNLNCGARMLGKEKLSREANCRYLLRTLSPLIAVAKLQRTGTSTGIASSPLHCMC